MQVKGRKEEEPKEERNGTATIPTSFFIIVLLMCQVGFLHLVLGSLQASAALIVLSGPENGKVG